MRLDRTSMCIGAVCSNIVVGLVLLLFLACIAKTTGIDDSDKQTTDVAGPSGETAAVGTGARVSQITTGNIALGGGWLAVPLVIGTLLVALRRRRQALQRLWLCGCNPETKNEFEESVKIMGIRLDRHGFPSDSDKQDTIGRVIARAVKRVTQK